MIAGKADVYRRLVDTIMEYKNKNTRELERLKMLVRDYHITIVACDACTELLLSFPDSSTPAKLMQDMYKAQAVMFREVGVEHYKGYGKRKKDST